MSALSGSSNQARERRRGGEEAEFMLSIRSQGQNEADQVAAHDVSVFTQTNCHRGSGLGKIAPSPAAVTDQEYVRSYRNPPRVEYAQTRLLCHDVCLLPLWRP